MTLPGIVLSPLTLISFQHQHPSPQLGETEGQGVAEAFGPHPQILRPWRRP